MYTRSMRNHYPSRKIRCSSVPILEDRFVPGTQSGWLGNGRAMEICKDMDFPSTIRPMPHEAFV